MKIVVPISRSDVHRLENWVEAIRKFGGLDTHSILFVPSNAVLAKAYEAAGKLGDVCKDIRVTVLQMDSDLGWPKASNWHWWSATQIMEELSAPWFWMELDCLPVRSGWATEIAAAYTSNGHPFMGCVVRTPWKNDQGEEVESLEGPEDKMMCGCGVYPSSLHARLKQIGQTGLMQSFTQGDTSADIPWDLFMRHVMRSLGMGHSDLIADFWNTQNYRIENGPTGKALYCDAKLTDAAGKPVSVHRAGIVNPKAATVHGCKDDTLFNLIMGGLDTRILAPLTSASKSSTQQSTAGVNPEVEALKAQLARMEQMMMQVMAKPAVVAPSPAIPIPVISPLAKGSMEEAVVECLKNSTVALRLAQVVGLTGVSQDIIRKMAQQPEALFTIAKGGLGWMKLKSLTTV